jgi:hypothetical protein
MRTPLFIGLFLILFSQALSATPLSRWDRFICDDGIEVLLKKNFVISFYQAKTLRNAESFIHQIEDIHDLYLNDRKNTFFSKYKIGIIKDNRSNTFHIIDQICYSNSPASVNAYMIGNKDSLTTEVLKVHSSRWRSTAQQDRDYYQLKYDGKLIEFKP